jgi:hypothetical protein
MAGPTQRWRPLGFRLTGDAIAVVRRRVEGWILSPDAEIGKKLLCVLAFLREIFSCLESMLAVTFAVAY